MKYEFWPPWTVRSGFVICCKVSGLEWTSRLLEVLVLYKVHVAAEIGGGTKHHEIIQSTNSRRAPESLGTDSGELKDLNTVKSCSGRSESPEGPSTEIHKAHV